MVNDVSGYVAFVFLRIVGASLFRDDGNLVVVALEGCARNARGVENDEVSILSKKPEVTDIDKFLKPPKSVNVLMLLHPNKEPIIITLLVSNNGIEVNEVQPENI